jgi:hypothetical protein
VPTGASATANPPKGSLIVALDEFGGAHEVLAILSMTKRRDLGQKLRDFSVF